MQKTARREDLERLVGQMHVVMHGLTKGHFGEFCPVDTWAPAVNVYHLGRRIELCMDLAGVDRSTIDVTVRPGRLTIRGMREAPDPEPQPGEAMRIVTMEIDHGPFSRTIPLPEQVDLQRVTSNYEQGMLWVELPLRGEA